MGIKLEQQLKLGQTLQMTQQMSQAISILALPHLEMTQIINKELCENPLLEEVESESEHLFQFPDAIATIEGTSDILNNQQILNKRQDDFDWHQYAESFSTPSLPYLKEEGTDDESSEIENRIPQSSSIHDHLLWQLSMLQVTEEEFSWGQYIIQHLEDKGLLTMSFQELYSSSPGHLNEEEARRILLLIQGFDPIGCACSSTQESLLVQARYMEPKNDLAILILKDFYHELLADNLSSLVDQHYLSDDDLASALQFIKRLSPCPGNQYSTGPIPFIVPDLYLHIHQKKLLVNSNNEGLPQLKMAHRYHQLLKKMLQSKQQRGTENKKTEIYLMEKMKSAQFLIKSLQFRKQTLLAVGEAIIEWQKDFFLHSSAPLRSMILKDIARKLSLHESTISRATANKYIETPKGLFELKFFFNSGHSQLDPINKRIKEIISQEPTGAAYSDQKIAEILSAEGLHVARRTVAKYRELLNISSASKRKKQKK